MSTQFDQLQTALAGRYRLVRELGAGGTAVVYLADDARLQRQVAIKVLHPDLSATLGSERFLREITTTAQLNHPHILPLHDSGEAAGFLYFTMPYVEGESLRDLLTRERQLPLSQALEIVLEVGDALSYAHSRDVVHRDIKPENILLSGGHAVVADFGIARAITEAGGAKITSTGLAIGTPAYMSPEQAEDGPLDGRSDIYALGSVLYEMLAGEPPYTGQTARAVIAKQMAGPVPSVRVLRDTVPVPVDEAITKALAKVPADRFGTSTEFIDAIGGGITGGFARDDGTDSPTVRRVAAGLVTFALLVIAAAWMALRPSIPTLNANRIVAYPLVVSGGGEQEEVLLGQDVGYLIVASLDGWASLTWRNGLDLITDERYLQAPHLLTRTDKAKLARTDGAAYFVDGRVILTPDSAYVHLSLQQVARDSVVARADTAGSRADVRQLGLLAVGELLLSFLPPGESVDVSAVSGRSAEAIQAFVQAERHFQRGRFGEAFAQYQSAVREDSAFALAALRAARAAAWSDRSSEASGLIQIALRNEELLLPRDLELARGFEYFVRAQADSALHHFRQAIAIDSGAADAWMGVGEVFTHLLPGESPPDVLADAAFDEAFRRTGEFAPVLYHLVESALRRGDVQRARPLVEELREAQADTSALGIVELMLQCVEESPGDVDWQAAVQRAPRTVYVAAFSLSVGGRQPQCAHAAWNAVLAYDTIPSHRFSAMIGLQSLLVAMGRHNELTALLDSATATTALLSGFYLYDALVAPELDPNAMQAVDRLDLDVERLEDVQGEVRLSFLSALGTWYTRRGRLDDARAIRDHLVSRAERSESRHLKLLSQSLSAHVALAEGDSAGALRQFQSLAPTADQGGLAFRPWESLGSERLTHASVLFARGEYDEARRVADYFDSPAVAPYVLYLPASLSLRLRIAQALGDEDAAARYEARLKQLGRDDLVREEEVSHTP